MIMSITERQPTETSIRLGCTEQATQALACVEDAGESPISKVDEANIPVNVVISEPDQFNSKWILLADNFKPCNSNVEIEIYEVRADSREKLLAVIHSLIVPLYRNAVAQLEQHGQLFFWSSK